MVANLWVKLVKSILHIGSFFSCEEPQNSCYRPFASLFYFCAIDVDVVVVVDIAATAVVVMAVLPEN